jgi:hypothetical protein
MSSAVHGVTGAGHLPPSGRPCLSPSPHGGVPEAEFEFDERHGIDLGDVGSPELGHLSRGQWMFLARKMTEDFDEDSVVLTAPPRDFDEITSC